MRRRSGTRQVLKWTGRVICLLIAVLWVFRVKVVLKDSWWRRVDSRAGDELAQIP
jgi:hypothetical protein